jgi:2-dehydro-3-deoxyphosphooctonate aldolase (KDO 8-P synthase)
MGKGALQMILVSGPCVIENFNLTYSIAHALKHMSEDAGMDLVFKASFDKANRSSIHSYRGPGLDEGLDILANVKAKLGVKITTDVHTAEQVEPVANVVDIIQTPAFLCRQTDLLVAAGSCGLPVNIKKGQFMSPDQMDLAVNKVRSGGCRDITVIERGTCFGYNNLVVDFRGIVMMRKKYPVIFDATHSVQLPGIGGQAEFIPYLARAAAAVGVDGIFIEVYPNPIEALCDGENSLRLDMLPKLLKEINGTDIQDVGRKVANF